MSLEPHSGAVSRAGLLLADFLVGIGGVEPAGPLLLLTLGKWVLPQGRVTSIIIKLGERRCRSRHLHLPPRPRALQQQRETVGVTRSVALRYNRGAEPLFRLLTCDTMFCASDSQHFPSCQLINLTEPTL